MQSLRQSIPWCGSTVRQPHTKSRFAKLSNMKSANTGKPSRTNLAKLKKRSDSMIDVTGSPYDGHSAQHVNRFWENATVMPGRLRGQRGPQRTPTKQMVSMRLDRLVVEHFKADGPD